MRLLRLLIVLAIPVLLAVWLAGAPGAVRIVWQDTIIETSAAVLAVLVLAFGVVLVLLDRFWRLLLSGPRFWRLRRRISTLEEGQEKLAQGFAALAKGEGAEAGRLALAARKKLGPSPMTHLLQAKAAQRAGDGALAREAFRALAQSGPCAGIGWRGLIGEAASQGDWGEVERLSQLMAKAEPKAPWLQLVRFELALRRDSWREASLALLAAKEAKLVAPAFARATLAALFAASAQEEARQGNLDEALAWAERAVREAPTWLPALLVLAERQIALGHERTAARTIARAYDRAPHPDLAALALRLAPQETPLAACKRIEKLTRAHKDDPVSLLAQAKAALAADLWGEARRDLTTLVARHQATRQTYALLAKLDQREGRSTLHKDLLLGAVAPAGSAALLPDPAWFCPSCGGSAAHWQIRCPSCGAFQTLRWQTPGEQGGQASAQGPVLLGLAGGAHGAA